MNLLDDATEVTATWYFVGSAEGYEAFNRSGGKHRFLSALLAHDGTAPVSMVWHTEHKHYHHTEPSGPAPPGKVWSPTHGHWHDDPEASPSRPDEEAPDAKPVTPPGERSRSAPPGAGEL